MGKAGFSQCFAVGFPKGGRKFTFPWALPDCLHFPSRMLFYLGKKKNKLNKGSFGIWAGAAVGGVRCCTGDEDEDKDF